MATFGSRLKELRLNKALGQKEIGSLLGVSDSSIRKYEAGNRTPDPDAIKKLAKFFDVSTDYLLGYSKEPLPSPKSCISQSLENNSQYLISLEDLTLLNQIKNLPPDRREIVDTIIKINEKEKEFPGERASENN